LRSLFLAAGDASPLLGPDRLAGMVASIVCAWLLFTRLIFAVYRRSSLLLGNVTFVTCFCQL
jgi:hypothetical protein